LLLARGAWFRRAVHESPCTSVIHPPACSDFRAPSHDSSLLAHARADPAGLVVGSAVATGARAGPAGGKKPDAKKPGGLVIPKPINLPSRRKENHGFDPGVSLVPTGTTGSWLSSGARPGVAVPAGVPLGTAGAYPGPFRPGAGPQAVAPPRAGAPGGWGASASSGGNAAAAVGGRGPSGGDFPELGGPAKPANPWKAPTPARSADDLRSRMGGAAGGAGSVAAAGDGWGNGRDWAEEAEDQPMDFRRPVVVEKESGGASRTASASASTIPSASTAPAGSIAVPFSATSALSSQSDSAGSMQRVDPREEARMLALRKQVSSHARLIFASSSLVLGACCLVHVC